VEEAVDAKRLGVDVGRELEKLPERQRMALWLSAAEGHSYAEVALILETTEKSVKALVHRGRAALVVRMGECAGSMASMPRRGTI
jgi:DNA-directed RNA polymerase specialized sigma24 family protein